MGSSSMTHQYKRRQQTLTAEINKLNQLIAEREDQIQVQDENYSKMVRESEKQLDAKVEENKILQKKIEEMSSQFAAMLKETLERMDKRIDMAQWDNGEN